MEQFATKFKYLLYITLLGILVLIFITFFFRIVIFLLPNEVQNAIGQLLSSDFSENKELLTSYIGSFGNKATFVFVGIQSLQVVLAPIPGQVTGLLGGYIFGFWEGLMYTMIGLTIGSFIAMLIGRLFGVKIISKFVPKKILSKYDYLLSDDTLQAFFFIFLLPFFPDDAICFVAGMTRIKLWKLMAVCIVGRLPGMAVFSYMGSVFGEDTTLAFTIFIIAVLLSTLFWLFDDKIKLYLNRFITFY